MCCTLSENIIKLWLGAVISESIRSYLVLNAYIPSLRTTCYLEDEKTTYQTFSRRHRDKTGKLKGEQKNTRMLDVAPL
jgi:hypothetical protein